MLAFRPLFAAMALTATSADARGQVVFAGPAWAAIDFGSSCEARSRAVLLAPKGKVQATAGFAFTSDHRRWGEFHAVLRRMPRQGSSAILTVANRPFLLVTRGNIAWSRGPAQAQAIMAALRSAGSMRVESRDQAGRRFADTYALAGAPTAIDAAAAACAGKSMRR
jgi:hypothetical protein